MRCLDLECQKCGDVVRDLFVRSRPERVLHFGADGGCMGEMDEVLLPRPRNAAWSDRDAVVVFRKPDGSISYPGRNDTATPRGCERITMRSLREVEHFEKQHSVRCEAAHYDHGNGPEIIDRLEAMPPIEKRREAFMRAWRG